MVLFLLSCGGPPPDPPRSAPPKRASVEVDAGAPAPTAGADAADAGVQDAGVKDERTTTRTLPAPPGWVVFQPVRTTAFAKPVTYYRVSREVPGTCSSYRFDGAKVISREAVLMSFLGIAKGDDAFTPPFTMIASYKLNRLAPQSFELEPGDWDYFDAKGRRYTNVGKGVALCGYPRFVIVGESATALEVIEGALPIAAYDPDAVEPWFKSEASCKASLKPTPAHGCR